VSPGDTCVPTQYMGFVVNGQVVMNTRQETRATFDSILVFYMFWASFDRWKIGFSHGLTKRKGLLVELRGDMRNMNDFWYDLGLGLRI